MGLILSIDTAMETAGLCLAEDEQVLTTRNNNRQTDHAAWMHQAIRDALDEAGKDISNLDAVAVTSGPGSYTGLRVGLASAKGLCYVLNIPLITETTLYLNAFALSRSRMNTSWICPMIDARRMEVFATVYDEHLVEMLEPAAVVLDEYSFQHFLDQHPVTFCGSGTSKWSRLVNHHNAFFSDISYTMADFAVVAARKFSSSLSTDLAYSEPFYVKKAYTGTKDA